MKKPRLDRIDLSLEIPDKDSYERRLEKLQLRLLQIQQAYRRQRRRALIVFEGWDTAGKGGTIRRLSERLDPRHWQAWPIGVPAPEEQGRHYFYRFWTKLPAPGCIAAFDRSWYGRVLVERVERLAPKPDWKRAYDEINEFERTLIDDGVRIVKIFLHISPAEQLRRLKERLDAPWKRWKLTRDDLRNRARWNDYAEAVDDMFERTSTRHAPWHAVSAEYKWHGRIRALEIIADRLGKGIDLEPPPADPKIARAIRAMVRQAKTGRRALKP
jgi:polyphosphate kinase 2 (PPK2 family)